MGIAVIFFLALGVIFAISLLYLLVVALVPGIKAPAVSVKKEKGTGGGENDLSQISSKTHVSFAVKDTKIRGWLFLPRDMAEPVACIIMAHGFGGTKDMGLESYAIRFQDAGFAVLVFDYRYFGESEGTPRQLLWIPFQLEDWSAAIEYARNIEGIDQEADCPLGDFIERRTCNRKSGTGQGDCLCCRPVPRCGWSCIG